MLSIDPVLTLAVFTLVSVLGAAALELRRLRKDQEFAAARIESRRARRRC